VGCFNCVLNTARRCLAKLIWMTLNMHGVYDHQRNLIRQLMGCLKVMICQRSRNATLFKDLVTTVLTLLSDKR
jgi:hypothetical protein